MIGENVKLFKKLIMKSLANNTFCSCAKVDVINSNNFRVFSALHRGVRYTTPKTIFNVRVKMSMNKNSTLSIPKLF